MAAAPRRVQSFSHLPRPRLSREEFLRYLGDRVAAEHARGSDPTDSGVVGGAIVEGVHEAKQNDVIRKDSGPQVSGTSVVESGQKEVLEGGVVGSDDTGGAVPRKRLLFRRWPSSADIGMVTDGL